MQPLACRHNGPAAACKWETHCRIYANRPRVRTHGVAIRTAATFLLLAPMLLAAVLVVQSFSSNLLAFIRSHSQVSLVGVRSLRNGALLQEHRAGLLLRRSHDALSLERWKAGPAEIYTGPAQKAMYLLKEHPELFEAAVEEELEVLAHQREDENYQKESLLVDAKEDVLVLRKRIEEVRESEREKTATELLYLKVCNKFKGLQVPLIPPLTGEGEVKFSNADLKELTADIYSKDAFELVKEHLFSIIGQQGGISVMGSFTVVQMALIQASQVYALSSFFGYYLRRVDSRYQLEKLAGSLGSWGEEDFPELNPILFAEDDKAANRSLKDYIKAFGPQEMMKMTSITSKEAQYAMERQVSALFGDLPALKRQLMRVMPPVNSAEEANAKLQEALQNGEVESIQISTEDVRRIVLEAVAFGALLHDAEKQVQTIYELTPKARSGRVFGGVMGEERSGPFLSD